MVEGGSDHLPCDLVLALGALPLFLARLLVHNKFGLLDQMKVHGERNALTKVEARHQVDTFDIAI